MWECNHLVLSLKKVTPLKPEKQKPYSKRKGCPSPWVTLNLYLADTILLAGNKRHAFTFMLVLRSLEDVVN